MPETPPSKSHTKTVANMQSALEYYAARDEHVSFEGILQPDKNNDNNTLIIVNSTELYSVPTATLLPVERVYTGLPQRVWVPKNTQVWRCELTNLDLQTQEHVKAADLPNLLDKHLSAHPVLSELIARAPVVSPAVAKAPSNNERCFIANYNSRGYNLKPEDLGHLLADVFGKSMDQLRIDPLYNEWATPCLRQRPNDPEVYLKEFRNKNISTLSQFIAVFGR